MGNRRTTGRLSALLVGLFAAGPVTAACLPGVVDVRGPFGQARFTVELADTPDARSRGLMFRESMASAAGMLFIYPNPQRASFWMKNTLIPLDMIFADASGRVTRVHAGAKPKDLTAIDGGDGVVMVLEINGGLAAKLGIAPGAELRHPAVSAQNAVWPCTE